MVKELGRVPSPGARILFRPVTPLLREVGATWGELLELNGGIVGDFQLMLVPGGQVRFERVTMPATPSGVPTAASSSTAFVPAAASGGNALAEETRARHAQMCAQLAEVTRRCANAK
jgi:hypothetical protein